MEPKSVVRVLPHRWWILPITLVLGASSIWPFLIRSSRFRREGTAPPTPATAGDLLTVLVIGASLGVIFGLVYLVYCIPRDSQLIAARKHGGSGVVFQARRSATGPADLLNELTAHLLSPYRPGPWVTIAFDRDGMHVWTGGTRARPVLIIPWAQISDVQLVSVSAASSRYGQQEADWQLELSIVRDEKIEELLLGAEYEPRAFSFRPYRNGQEMWALLAEIEDARQGVIKVDSAHASERLVPGTTAWNASQLARLVGVVAALGAILTIASSWLIASNWSTTAGIWALSALPALLVMVLIARARAARAVQRELRAGYTTLNAQHLEVAQRHPQTGEVIRPANHPALDERDLFRMLRVD